MRVRLSDRVAGRLGAAAGLIGAGVLVGAAWLSTPVWAAAPDVSKLLWHHLAGRGRRARTDRDPSSCGWRS